jgi:hypothetical protein
VFPQWFPRFEMANLISPSVVHRYIVQDAIFARKTVRGVENSRCPIERCTRQYALNAVRNVKFPSSPTRTGQFTAENAGKGKGRPEGDIRILTLIVS